MTLRETLLAAAFCAIGTTNFADASRASSLSVLSNFPASGRSGGTANFIRYRDALFGIFSTDTGDGVYEVHLKNGHESTIHVFTGSPDAGDATSAFVFSGGHLYGTTVDGGKHNGGAIYQVDPATGNYKVVYSFPLDDKFYDSDPASALVTFGSKLIGTTAYGGQIQDGSIYEFDPATGTVATLYEFTGNLENTDGDKPSGDPIIVGDKVYGVTQYGGDLDDGILYEYDLTTGVEKNLFSFGGAEGYYAYGNLVKVGDSLYGVAYTHGTPIGYGSVYRYDLKTKTGSLVHAFGGQAQGDGAHPNSGLTYVGGLIYGTTESGGSANFGTIYSVDPATGTETTLYSFTNGADGGYPYSGLLSSHGKFYGTTIKGGAHGTGTVFSFTP